MVRIALHLCIVALLVSTCGPQSKTTSAASKDNVSCKQLRGQCISLFAATHCGDFRATSDCQKKPEHGCCYDP